MGDEHDRELVERLESKLDVLIAVVAADQLDDEKTVKEKVKILHGYGIRDNGLMANVIGTTKNTISTKKSNLKKDGEIDD